VLSSNWHATMASVRNPALRSKPSRSAELTEAARGWRITRCSRNPRSPWAWGPPFFSREKQQIVLLAEKAVSLPLLRLWRPLRGIRSRSHRMFGQAREGTCDNTRSGTLRRLEKCVLGALEEHLLHEDVVTAAVRAYHDERQRLSAEEHHADRARGRRLGEVERTITRLVDLVCAGRATDGIIERLHTFEAEKKALLTAIADAAKSRM
jgi:hypothetical protein